MRSPAIANKPRDTTVVHLSRLAQLLIAICRSKSICLPNLKYAISRVVKYSEIIWVLINVSVNDLQKSFKVIWFPVSTA